MKTRHKFAMLVFLFSPLAVVTLLCVLIARSLDDGIVKQTPLGAGGGETGGANFIGDQIAKRDRTPAAITHANGHSTALATAHPDQPDEMVNPVTLDTGFLIVVTDKAGKATPSSPIHLAGTVNGWNPGHEQYRLTAQSDMRWRLHVTKEMLQGSPSTVEFKFTRGSWSLEELNADYSVPANKMLPKVPAKSIKPGEPPVIEYTIVAWSDTAPNAGLRHVEAEYRPVSAVGDLRRLQVQGGVGNAAGRTRDLLVWLPPGYDDAANAARAYPVLYMMDGQNLFEKPASAPGEWKADETATALITAGKARPFIIVGVPNSGTTRLAEYMPPGMGKEPLKDRTPMGDAHLDWLVHTAMPRVESAFRVAKGAEHTGIGGSSMGGLIALHAGATRPDTFGLVLAESPALALRDSNGWRGVFEPTKRWPGRVFIAVGGKEGFADKAGSDAFAASVKEFDAMLASAGLDDSRKRFVFEPDAVHNEDAWAARLPGALAWLFAPSDGGSR
jgi:pullulanase